MDFISVKDASKTWGISERRIRVLCNEGRIEGAFKIGKTWNIPKNCLKPVDKRIKDNKVYYYGIEEIDFSRVDFLIEKYNSLKPLSNNQLRMIREDLNLRWTYNSNAIEGNTFTLKETKVALEGITIGGKSLVEHLEVVNHQGAIEYFEEVSVNEELLSERVIKDIHRLILVNIDNKNAGSYRKENVIISGANHIPPKHYDLDLLMKQFVEDANKEFDKYHPIVKAALIHGEFVKIHPFVDGNGRTSRILMNFSLMNSGLIPVIIKKEDRLRYYDALDKAHTLKEYKDFIELIKENIINEFELRLSLLS